MDGTAFLHNTSVMPSDQIDKLVAEIIAVTMKKTVAICDTTALTTNFLRWVFAECKERVGDVRLGDGYKDLSTNS